MLGVAETCPTLVMHTSPLFFVCGWLVGVRMVLVWLMVGDMVVGGEIVAGVVGGWDGG